jgi:hypothetical protein
VNRPLSSSPHNHRPSSITANFVATFASLLLSPPLASGISVLVPLPRCGLAATELFVILPDGSHA